MHPSDVAVAVRYVSLKYAGSFIDLDAYLFVVLFYFSSFFSMSHLIGQVLSITVISTFFDILNRTFADAFGFLRRSAPPHLLDLKYVFSWWWCLPRDLTFNLLEKSQNSDVVSCKFP